MINISKSATPNNNDVETFLSSINFNLPEGFIDFLKQTNGADVNNGQNYLLLWPLTDLLQLNKEYSVEEFAPDFFIFGSNGGETAYAIDKKTGYIFEIPFIGMSNENAVFKVKTFGELLNSL